jgi:hypothetical protein
MGRARTGFWPVRCMVLISFFFAVAASGADLRHEGMFVSAASRAGADAIAVEDVVVADFGGRAAVPEAGIVLSLNDPWNRLWPLASRLVFYSVPIELRWMAFKQIYVELEAAGWELLYSPGLGPEVWTPIADHPKSSASGDGWVVDLNGETEPALFRGRPSE